MLRMIDEIWREWRESEREGVFKQYEVSARKERGARRAVPLGRKYTRS
jgi:hypothetical protein